MSHFDEDGVAKADPSWYLRVLRTLARDYPEISDKVWGTAISENATEQMAKVRREAGCAEPGEDRS